MGSDFNLLLFSSNVSKWKNKPKLSVIRKIYFIIYVADSGTIVSLNFYDCAQNQFTDLSIQSSIRGCLHVPTPSLTPSPSRFIIVPMLTVCLSGRMGVGTILPVRRAVTISTMINFDGDGDGHGDGVGTCKHALTQSILNASK